MSEKQCKYWKSFDCKINRSFSSFRNCWEAGSSLLPHHSDRGWPQVWGHHHLQVHWEGQVQNCVFWRWGTCDHGGREPAKQERFYSQPVRGSLWSIQPDGIHASVHDEAPGRWCSTSFHDSRHLWQGHQGRIFHILYPYPYPTQGPYIILSFLIILVNIK